MNDPKRILVVLLGFILLCGFAFSIKNHMDSDGYKTQVEYTTAIQATDKTHFNYAVDTQQGNLLANGQFATDSKDLTKFPEMTKGFTYVRRTKEHYTMHEYTTCSGKPTVCTTHIYYSWDEVDSNEQYAPKISFYGRQYNPDIFNIHAYLHGTSCAGITAENTQHGFFSSKHGCDGTDFYLDSDDRYVYDTVPQTFTATFLASSMGGGLHGVGESTITLQNKSIGQALKDVGKYQLVAFWVAAVLIFFLFIGAAFAAYEWVMEDGEWSTRD